MNWTQDQPERKARAEAGECVVANVRKGRDEALVAWARAQVRFVSIDRKSDWGNPFKIRRDGDRDAVCSAYRDRHLPSRPDLLRRLPTLRGKVLGYWCHPERCHGHALAALINRRA